MLIPVGGKNLQGHPWGWKCLKDIEQCHHFNRCLKYADKAYCCFLMPIFFGGVLSKAFFISHCLEFTVVLVYFVDSRGLQASAIKFWAEIAFELSQLIPKCPSVWIKTQNSYQDDRNLCSLSCLYPSLVNWLGERKELVVVAFKFGIFVYPNHRILFHCLRTNFALSFNQSYPCWVMYCIGQNWCFLSSLKLGTSPNQEGLSPGMMEKFYWLNELKIAWWGRWRLACFHLV